MARKEYLTPEERTRFDNPPQLLSEQKGLFLQIPEWASAYLKTLQTPTTGSRQHSYEISHQP